MEKDYKEAVKWYTKVAEQGYLKAKLKAKKKLSKLNNEKVINDNKNILDENKLLSKTLVDKYVFISYSSKNQSMADATRMLLKEYSIPCWMAPYDIPAGSKYAYVINDALENCSCLLLLLTNDSQNSQFVEKEVERAVTYKKSIITMQLEDVILNSGFKYFIGSEQIVAVHNIDRNNPEMQKIINGIKVFVSTEENK